MAKAGGLRGKSATTHWLASEQLAQYGATFKDQRVVWDKNVVSGAGVSAGIDLAFQIVENFFGREEAERIQLSIEYSP